MTTTAANPATGDLPLEKVLAPKRTPWQEFWGLFKKNRLAIAGMIILYSVFLRRPFSASS